MAIDSRLREGLQRSMSEIDADVELHLGDARRRGRRRLVVRRAATAVALIAVVVIVTLTASSVLDIVRDQHHRPAAPPSLMPISGTYTATIRARDTTSTTEAGAVGTWLLTFDGNGTLDLASLTNGDVGRSVTQYQVSGGEFITTALTGSTCAGTGRYTWSRIGSSLSFAVVNDPCPLRVAIFTSRPWTSA